MKKIFFLFTSCSLMLLLSTCKKDKLDVPIGTFKAKINGNEKTFNILPKATRLSVTGGHGIQIQGFFRNGSTTDLTIIIVSPSPIITTTYTENTMSNPLVTMRHCIEILAPCVLQTISYISPSNPVSVTVNEITNAYVKGTFKGELKSPATSGSPTTDVFTDGVFYVSF